MNDSPARVPRLLRLLGVALLVALVVVCAMWCASAVLYSAFDFPANGLEECDDAQGAHSRSKPSEIKAFNACLASNAKQYVQSDYLESKDLAKTFLTFLSAILVTSITFSEKVVRVGSARKTEVVAMVVCWSLLLIAIVECALALGVMVSASNMATYQPDLDFRALEYRSFNLLVGAGSAFCIALVAIIVAGSVSLIHTYRASQKS